MKPRAPAAITIDAAMSDRKLLGAALGPLDSWQVWRVALKSAFALGLITDRERELFAGIAGDRAPPARRVRELWVLAGRRSGKSRIAALIAVYIACFVRHKLAPGETPTVLVLAGSTAQASTVFSYCRAFLTTSPILRREVESNTASELRLRNDVVIAVHPNSFRVVRGRTLIAAIFDEISYWRDDNSATPDSEVYSAVLPSLSTVNGMLISISTAYRRSGLMYAKHKAHFGVDSDDVLFLSGTTLQFNPTLDTAVIEAQRAADPVAARSEWDSEFRTDLEEFLSEELIEAAVDRDRPPELPPRATFTYACFVDAAGGTGNDAYCIAIAHAEGERIILDLVRGSSSGTPYDPAELTAAYAALVKQYRIFDVRGDYYAGEWVSSAWMNHGITYQRSPIPKSAIYLEASTLFARRVVSLPDHRILTRELRLLERRVGRSGRDAISHPSNAHDDYANCACGALLAVSTASGGVTLELLQRVNDTIPEPPARGLQKQYQQYAASPAAFGIIEVPPGGYHVMSYSEFWDAISRGEVRNRPVDIGKGRNVPPW